MNRQPSAHEIAAMFHWHDRYAAQPLGAIDFYRVLTGWEQAFIHDMVNAIVSAYEDDLTWKAQFQPDGTPK